MGKTIKILVFIAAVVTAGFMRETLFVRIAWQEEVLRNDAIPPASHWLFSFLEHLSLRNLVITRYAFTLFFIGVFFGLSLLMVKWFFNEKFYYRLVTFVFVFPFAAGVLLVALNALFPTAFLYMLNRWIIGLIETPLIIIILFPLLWINRRPHQ